MLLISKVRFEAEAPIRNPFASPTHENGPVALFLNAQKGRKKIYVSCSGAVYVRRCISNKKTSTNRW